MFAVLLAAVVALVLGYATKAYAAPGDLDPSFDGDGKASTSFTGIGNEEQGRDLAIQEDGKVVVAGHAYGGETTGFDFALTRYKPDGTLDTTFGMGGKVLTAVGPGASRDFARSVAVRPDGKIVVGGYTDNGGSNNDFALARYNPGGALDATFSGDGKAITPVGTGSDLALGVAAQGTKTVVTGISYNGAASSGGTENDLALVRYADDGNLDGTFSNDGKTTLDFSTGSGDFGRAVALEPGGKIVVAGNIFNPADNVVSADFALARFNADGSLDDGTTGDTTPGDTFGTGGKVITDFALEGDRASDVALQEDGKIVAAGWSTTGSSSDFALARYTPGGSLDGEFDFDGKLTTDFGGSDSASSVAMQDDGRIVVAGDSGGDFALACYNPDGSLNTSFNHDGKLKTDLSGGGWDGVSGVAVQEDAKIVAAGYTASGFSWDFAVARYFGGNDATPPVVKPPAQSLVTNSTLGTSTIPVNLSWSATDSEGTITRYELQRSTDGGAYQNVNLPGATTASTVQSLSPAHNYRFRVRATDDNGNKSFWKYGPRFTVDAHQETSSAIAYTGTWRAQFVSGAYGGAVKYATAAGAAARLTFAGANVAWVSPKSSTRGKADVYLDGKKVATVDLFSSTTLSRKVVYAAKGLDPTVNHTLEIKALGTGGRPRVDVDAFVVLR